MAKFKFDFTGEEYAKLSDPEEAKELIAYLHNALDMAISDRDDFVKCTITVDTDKD